MVRVVLAAIASFLLIAVLGLLIAESRVVDDRYYSLHNDRMKAIEASREDIAAIVYGAEVAHKEGRVTPAALTDAIARLSQYNGVLQEAADEPSKTLTDVDTELTLYDSAINHFVNQANAFVTRQNALAGALRITQEESPSLVKDLRHFELREEAQSTFTLAIDVIEYGTGQSRLDPAALKARVDSLSASEAVEQRAPGRLDDFVTAAAVVIEERSEASRALELVSGSRVESALWSLSDAILADNRSKVSRAERAQLLLSVCTVMLLAGIAYVVFRLQSSYRALNQSNAELESINNTLEERVNARTEELTAAYEELRESQVQLVQAEKMSSLGELVAGISHEINTPLWYLINNATIVQERLESVGQLATAADTMIGSIRNGTEVKTSLQQGLKEMHGILSNGLKDDLEEAVDLTKDSIEGLEDLTELAQSLKDFSRLDRAQHGQFNVNDGLDKTLLIAKNKLKNKVTVHKHFGEVPSLYCSPSQINQVFLNLITNAADAIDEQGEIVIHSWADDESVSVSVSDTGCGIPDDVMDKVRDPFFTTKEVGKGTGLGLSIVDRIVSSHGGSLDIQSEVGKGTVITVTFPLQANAAPDAAIVDEVLFATSNGMDLSSAIESASQGNVAALEGSEPDDAFAAEEDAHPLPGAVPA